MRSGVYFLVALVVAVTAITILIVYPTSYNCKAYQVPRAPILEGSLAVNDILTNAEFILTDAVFGPESVEVTGDVLYTGTQDGLVKEIRNGAVRKIAKFADTGLQCNGSYESEPYCGRPLGIRSIDGRRIIVVDAYLGLFYINFDENVHGTLLSKEQAVVNGKRLMFMNDVDLLSQDEIVFTDSSTRWNRRDYMKVLLEGTPNGRVVKINTSTKKMDVLLDGLHFANGIQFFPDKQSFLVAETTTARIRRHWISGSKAGETEIFADNLPGYPDNIRLGDDGTFWIALAAVRHSDAFSLLDFLANKPNLRKVILQTLEVLPRNLQEKLFKRFRSKHTMIIQMDLDGKIISSAHDPTGSVISDVSQVTDNGEYLYFGNLHGKYIARLHKSHLMKSLFSRRERASEVEVSDRYDGIETSLPIPDIQKPVEYKEELLVVEPVSEQELPNEINDEGFKNDENPAEEIIQEEENKEEALTVEPEVSTAESENIDLPHEEIPDISNIDVTEDGEQASSKAETSTPES